MVFPSMKKEKTQSKSKNISSRTPKQLKNIFTRVPIYIKIKNPALSSKIYFSEREITIGLQNSAVIIYNRMEAGVAKVIVAFVNRSYRLEDFFHVNFFRNVAGGAFLQ